MQYRISGELEPIQLCHCQQCRKAQGTPFVSNIPVPRAQFELLQGADLLKEYASSPGKARVFCSHCGSPLYSHRLSDPGTIRLRAGSLDQDLAVRPGFHAYTASAANWWRINDQLPQYPEGAPPPPTR
ncbi:MAG: GFA family protein [Halopseudomonas sp.]